MTRCAGSGPNGEDNKVDTAGPADVCVHQRHLSEHWTQREVDRFDKEVDAVLSAISTFPGGFRRGGESDVREAVVKPWNLLIYRVRKGHVELLTFWDTRRDPRRKPRFRKRR